MQKARRHPDKSGLRPFVSARFQVLFHSSVRGAFHLSLTVLVHYRSLRSIQPYRMVPADSHRISRVPRYSGYCQFTFSLRVQDYHLVSYNFPGNSTSKNIFILQSYNPIIAETIIVWAMSLFDRLYQGNHYCFLFLRVLRCFSSPGLLPDKSG